MSPHDRYENPLLTNPPAFVCLQVAVLFYVLVSAVPIVVALRAVTEGIVSRKTSWPKTGTWGSHVVYTTGIVGASLAGGLLAKGRSEVVFALTGATGVSLVCYVIPAIIHVTLWVRDKTHPTVCEVCSCVGYVDGKLCEDASRGCACVSDVDRVPRWRDLHGIEPLSAVDLVAEREREARASVLADAEDGLTEPLLCQETGQPGEGASQPRPFVSSGQEMAAEIAAPVVMGLAGLGVGALGVFAAVQR